MQRIAIYGKGGIGKTTLATNLSVAFAQQGRRVLHVGCDPKHDSSMILSAEDNLRLVIEQVLRSPGSQLRKEDVLMQGRLGIHCVEAGGPEPGVGCGGRGITRMFEVLEDLDVIEGGGWDVMLFDVLGDVVCGGFAAPLRQGYAETVVIVTSEEMMSLYAANNICKAVRRFRNNGVTLAGLVLNLRDHATPPAEVERFAARIDAPILAVLPRDPLVREAERRRRTVLEHAPECPWAERIRDLSRRLEALRPDDCRPPRPLEQSEFAAFMTEGSA